MALNFLDWSIVAVFLIFSLGIGVAVSRKSGKNSSEFFLSGRNMPWWLLGVSMVATTFSSDTPNLVTDIVRQNGVAGNWAWWAFLLTGMLTVFVYAKLWRRSNVLTDVEFYEIRYSGKAAAFLRGFRALYLGVFFNVLVLASVSLAIIKIGGVLLNLTPVQTLVLGSIVTVIYSALGGLRGVLITDFFQFIIAMIGSLGAAYIALNLPQVGGLSNLLSHPVVQTKLSILPDFSNTDALVTLLILPLAVQWWSVWYPGSEPGGGGYIAQRMLSARNEKNAIGATLFFNIAHYAVRPWPWIIVALSSIVVFPEIKDLQAAFPHIDAQVVQNDLAYPAMLTYLPHGLLGLVAASLIAAYMSTISTQLNLGSSYIVNDFYKRFVKPQASEKELVLAGRISTVILMILVGFLTLLLSNALQAFNIMLQIGAGTGLLFILRWFWWRINPISELTAMFVSFFIAIYFQIIHPLLGFEMISNSVQLVSGVAITTIAWVSVTFMTKPTDINTLIKFYNLVKPGGPGWKVILDQAEVKGIQVHKDDQPWEVPTGILMMFIGCFLVYGSLFATGFWIYGNYANAVILTIVSIIAAFLIFKMWKKMRAN